MCATNDLLNRFAKAQNLSHDDKTLHAAAQFFYSPGSSQPEQFKKADVAAREAQKTIGTVNQPPVWLDRAVACAERYPAK